MAAKPAAFLLTPNPRAQEYARRVYMQASIARRPASAPLGRRPVETEVPLTPLQLLRQRSSRPTSAAPREEPSLSEFGEVNLSTVGSRLSRPSSAAQLRLGAQQAPPVPAVALPLTMTFGRPASAGAVRAGDQRGQGQIAVSPETGAEDQGRPTSAPSVHSSVASGSAASVATSQVPMEAARPFQVHDAVEPPSGAKNCTAEVSQSSLSTQQPLHSETSQELDVPEEDCDDATEAELQKRVEELRRQELEEKLAKLQQQQEEIEEERQEVQKLLQKPPIMRRPSRAESMTELRIDGKAISGSASRSGKSSRHQGKPFAPSLERTVPFRPASSPAIRRSSSAAERGVQQWPPRGGSSGRMSLRDLHYESMRRQAAARQDLVQQREIVRKPWTHGGSRPARPWSAIPGYTGHRPRMEEEDFVGHNWHKASLQCIRLFQSTTRKV